MRLPVQEAKLYFDLMWSLQYFVGQKLQMVPGIQSVEQYEKCPLKKKQKVRKALFSDKAFIEAFVEENPQKLSEEKLGIILTWQHAVQGQFVIERFLKKYAIFIQDSTVYGVMGLYDDIEDVIPPAALPLYVDTILLPFKERIIYDGLFAPYSISFGPGIRYDLKECYNQAKKNGQIVEQLSIVKEVV